MKKDIATYKQRKNSRKNEMKRVCERKFQSFRFMGQLLDKEVQSFSVLHNIKKS